MNAENPGIPSPLAWPLARVGAWALGAMLIIAAAVWYYRTISAPPAMTTNHPSLRVMTWGGTSRIGYLRVELWSEQGRTGAPTQTLLVYTTDGTVVTYQGAMVSAPPEMSGASVQREYFVRSKDHLLGIEDGRPPTILATVSDEGVLHLYAFGVNAGVALPPIN
jgi:hypothetical protein